MVIFSRSPSLLLLEVDHPALILTIDQRITEVIKKCDNRLFEALAAKSNNKLGDSSGSLFAILKRAD